MALSRKLRRAVGVALAGLSAIGAASSARGQHSADPYKPYNAQYDQYIYPSYPTGEGVTSNQTLLEGRPANQYRSFLEEMDEAENGPVSSSASPIRRGIGVPYYRAYRELDRSLQRVYTPNANADKAYLANRRSRDEAYSDYLKAHDPKDRARYRKEYEQYNQKALRDLSETRSEGTQRPAARPRPSATAEALPPRPSQNRPRTAAPPARGPAATSARASGNRSTTARGGASASPSETLRRSELEDRAGAGERVKPPAASNPPQLTNPGPPG